MNKPCGCHLKFDNYLVMLLNNIIIQQYQFFL